MSALLCIKYNASPATVAPSCNSSYSGGRDQEDHGSKPAQANSFARPYLKENPSHKKRAGGVAQSIGPEFLNSSTVKIKNF
jgi:hypothetical protein